MLTLLLSLASAQSLNLKDEGVNLGWVRTLDCVGSSVACSIDTTTRVGTMTITGGGGGGGLPDGGDISGEPFVTFSSTSVLSSDRVLSAGNYTTVDLGTSGQAQVDWAHGLTCSSGQAMTSSGTSALACTSTLTASDVVCAGTCVSSAEIVSVTGAQVSSAVATATALAADPTDCSPDKFATSIAASGNLSCQQVDYSQLSGSPTLSAATITSGTLAAARGGLGAAQPTCSAGDFLTCNGTTCSCSTPVGGSGGISYAEATAASLAGF